MSNKSGFSRKTSDPPLKDNLAILAIKTNIFQGPHPCATLPLAGLLCYNILLTRTILPPSRFFSNAGAELQIALLNWSKKTFALLVINFLFFIIYKKLTWKLLEEPLTPPLLKDMVRVFQAKPQTSLAIS